MVSKILAEIIEDKKKEIEMDKLFFPLAEFKQKLPVSNKDYIQALSKDKLGLIAEIKPKSPSKGFIRKSIDIKEIVKSFETRAQCISVLTDSKYFGGSLKLLELVSNYSKLPVLRKDFILDEYQIYQARLFGADAVLLIASLLSAETIERFLEIAKDLGMVCQVEIHDDEDLEKVLQTSAKLIGINNRNLKTMEIDINITVKLAKQILEDKLIISESGINNNQDIKNIEPHINAVHIGAALMESDDIKQKIDEIFGDKDELQG